MSLIKLKIFAGIIFLLAILSSSCTQNKKLKTEETSNKETDYPIIFYSKLDNPDVLLNHEETPAELKLFKIMDKETANYQKIRV